MADSFCSCYLGSVRDRPLNGAGLFGGVINIRSVLRVYISRLSGCRAHTYTRLASATPFPLRIIWRRSGFLRVNIFAFFFWF